ncbi:MAG: oligoendopeptidase F [Christensenellales bacterium]
MNVKTRTEIPVETTWRLEDIFESDQLWEHAFSDLKNRLLGMEALQGTLNTLSGFAKAMDQVLDAQLAAERLFVYSRMRRDEDNAKGIYQAMFDRALGLSTQMSASLSFMTSELSSLSDDTLLDYAKNLPQYKKKLEDIIRGKAHILTTNEERLLAMAGEMAESTSTAFTMFNNVDLKLGKITMPDGTELPITHASYQTFLEDQDRDVRRQAYEAVYTAYGDNRNTFGALLSGSIKTELFYSRARKFSSTRDSALFDSNVPTAVYDTLIDTVRANLHLTERYLMLRKKVLGLNELKMYDIYVPLFDETKREIVFDKAKDMVMQGLAPLGEQYGKILQAAFENRWIDVYENKGKTSGAYSWGAYGTHPYVLLNYRPDLDSVSTIAHELGHALHSYYSDEAQPYVTAGYKIFVAEVASTVNEVLLIEHLLKATGDKKMRLSLLNSYLEHFRTTVFRQTMFAEFERTVHNLAQEGEALTAQRFSEIYGELNSAYYQGVAQDDYIAMEWARIPHFYNGFYVYQYATGFSAAVAIARQLMKNGSVDGYMKFLASGGSDHPIEELKLAGVDLSRPEPVQSCMTAFQELLDQLEAII